VRLVLASHSPQRRAILEQLGIPFELRPVEIEELEEGEPEAVARLNADRKAAASAAAGAGGGGEVVLGVDTVVALGGEIFGKPPDPDAAAATLRRLAGRTHEVFSGIALVQDGRTRTAVARTAVRFRPLDEGQIAGYVAAGEWRGRAGGYAIQGRGAMLVAGIEGDYLNVVGLPVATLADLWPDLLEIGR
jgi:septum formation protein